MKTIIPKVRFTPETTNHTSKFTKVFFLEATMGGTLVGFFTLNEENQIALILNSCRRRKSRLGCIF